MGQIFNIPAGVPFAKSLAGGLLREFEDNPEGLSDLLILLPTRRACRTMREAFLQGNAGKPILLPRMQALGDIDEEELSLSIAGHEGLEGLLDLPPSLSPMRRQILLARAIVARPDFPHSFDHALSLAKDLGHVMDQIYTENLDMKDLAGLVPEDFAAHWQVTLDFLKILSEEWPKILAELGVIDGADRRNRLILALAAFWDAHPPEKRIIAAGTTGSIPATAALLKTVLALPNGEIVLPGFDTDIDEESWEALGESHPQYGFKHLFGHLGVERDSVRDWVVSGNADICVDRRFLASHMMRPAETTKAWQGLKADEDARGRVEHALQDLEVYHCATHQQEAQVIAVLMRSILEEPQKTAALITPDRVLAKRVATACSRWGIVIDDSAGTPLTQSDAGRFLMVVLEACAAEFSPVALLSLLKHPLCSMDMERAEYQKILRDLELYMLRGLKPPAGFAGLYIRLEDAAKEHEKDFAHVLEFLQKLGAQLSPLIALFDQEDAVDFKKLLKTHLEVCENLSTPDLLWSGDAGQSLAVFLSDLFEHASLFPSIYARDYALILSQFLAAQTLRPAYGTHPRLQILGQLEARLIDADLVILAGLNEGTWPPDAGHDPWMSRPMRKEFGLPGAERSIGLTAHDFVQGFCVPRVVLTRSSRVDGTPSVPARWLQRLDTVLEAAECDADELLRNIAMGWVQAMDHADEVRAIERPAPKPMVAVRPRKLPITQIETWLRDPYAIYARYVLKLRKLDALEKNADAAIRGQILHDVLDGFITAHPKDLPQNAADILRDLAVETLPNYHLTPEDWAFYWPRFDAVAETFLQKENEWRDNAAPYKTEVKGGVVVKTSGEDFIIYGRADRIDRTADGKAAIIDYKSGGQFTMVGMKNGDAPQLPLEAFILQHGGFENTDAAKVEYLGYWVLNAAGKHTEIREDVGDIVAQTGEALRTLIETFDDENVPYHAVPRSDKFPRFLDYEHLARVKEWAALDGHGETSGEAA